MNAQSFLANFEHIANAPNGIKRLREMIYYLGVIGALCPQNRAEGNGAELLEVIEREKQTRIEQGLFKRSLKFENLKEMFTESLPDIPEAWVWTRLVDIGEINPKNDADDDVMTSFASMSAISEMHDVPPQPENRLWGVIKKGFTHFANGDVAVAKITPCFENGKAAVIRDLTGGIGAGTTELHVFRPLPGIDPAFIYIFLRSPNDRYCRPEEITN
jgi:type I restriction enzyme S subunit